MPELGLTCVRYHSSSSLPTAAMANVVTGHRRRLLRVAVLPSNARTLPPGHMQEAVPNLSSLSLLLVTACERSNTEDFVALRLLSVGNTTPPSSMVLSCVVGACTNGLLTSQYPLSQLLDHPLPSCSPTSIRPHSKVTV